MIKFKGDPSKVMNRMNMLRGKSQLYYTNDMDRDIDRARLTGNSSKLDSKANMVRKNDMKIESLRKKLPRSYLDNSIYKNGDGEWRTYPQVSKAIRDNVPPIERVRYNSAGIRWNIG